MGATTAPEVSGMSLVRCPHCGAQNFTIESWEDLDRCSSCGKPLGEPENGDPVEARVPERSAESGDAESAPARGGGDAKKPPSA